MFSFGTAIGEIIHFSGSSSQGLSITQKFRQKMKFHPSFGLDSPLFSINLDQKSNFFISAET